MEDALVRDTGVAVGKRHRTSTPVVDVANPEKCAKSDPGQSQEVGGSTREPIPLQSRDLAAPGETQLQMSTAVQLERFRPMGRDEEMSGVVEGQGDTPRSTTTSPVPPAGSPGSTKKTKAKCLRSRGHQPKRLPPGKRDLLRRRSDNDRIRRAAGPLTSNLDLFCTPGAGVNGNGYARGPTWIPDN